MSARTIQARYPLPPLSKLVLAAVVMTALVEGVVLLLIGQFDVEVSYGLGFLLVAGALVATGWRWTPAAAALLVGIPVVFGLPFLLDHLAHPGVFGLFATTVVHLACTLAALVGGIATTIQNYQGDRRAPGWLASAFAGLSGLVIGALLVGGFLATTMPEGIAAPSSGGVPTVHMGSGSFAVDTVIVPQGTPLRLINDGAFPHVLASGTWDGTVAKPAREPGAPPLENVQVNRKDQVVELGPFTTVGRYQFYCPIHPRMNLTVIVR